MPDPTYDPLLVELRRVTEQADPVPDSVVAAAKASFIWRTVDTELAELVADSLLRSAAVRSAEAGRLLTFRGPGLEVEVEVAQSGPVRRLAGQLVPIGPAGVTVSWATGSVQVAADEMGRFVAQGVPPGSVRIEVARPGRGRAVVTSWVSI